LAERFKAIENAINKLDVHDNCNFKAFFGRGKLSKKRWSKAARIGKISSVP